MGNALSCYSLTKNFGQITAVDRLSLEINENQIFGLLGPNGAGKSTLLKMLVGLVRPNSGWVEIAGFPPNHNFAKSNIGYLPELFRFPGWMTGLELLKFHGRLLNLPEDNIERRSLEVLELTGLSDAGNRRISQYSKGMQQRIGLAQAVLGRPKVLFLDEPTSALDPIGRVHVRDLLLKVREEGTTVFLNSHLLTDIEKICDRIAIMREGRIARTGSPEDFTKGQSLFVKINEIDNGLVDKIAKNFGPAHKESSTDLKIDLQSETMVPQIVEFLVAEGLEIYEIRQLNDSLEDVFLELFEGDRL